MSPSRIDQLSRIQTSRCSARRVSPAILLGCGLVFGLSMVAAPGEPVRSEEDVRNSLSRVQEYHGGAGPWAVAGYRIGERALKELGLPRQSFSLKVTHRSPAEVRYSCVVDGVQAATGASLGKLNLRMETVPVSEMCTLIENRQTGKTLKFTMRQDFVQSIAEVPHEKLAVEGKRVARLPDDGIFEMVISSK